MTCRTDGCRQGRDRCPTPALCTDNGGAHIDCGQVIGYESGGRFPNPPAKAKPKLRDLANRIGWWSVPVVAIVAWYFVTH